MALSKTFHGHPHNHQSMDENRVTPLPFQAERLLFTGPCARTPAPSPRVSPRG